MDYYPSRKWAKWEICYRELTKIFIWTWSCWKQLPNDIEKYGVGRYLQRLDLRKTGLALHDRAQINRFANRSRFFRNNRHLRSGGPRRIDNPCSSPIQGQGVGWGCCFECAVHRTPLPYWISVDHDKILHNTQLPMGRVLTHYNVATARSALLLGGKDYKLTV